MTKTQIRDQAMELPKEERINLAMDLWDSIEPDQATPLSDAQKRLLDARIAAYEENPEDVVPWEEVRGRVLSSLRTPR